MNLCIILIITVHHSQYSFNGNYQLTSLCVHVLFVIFVLNSKIIIIFIPLINIICIITFISGVVSMFIFGFTRIHYCCSSFPLFFVSLSRRQFRSRRGSNIFFVYLTFLRQRFLLIFAKSIIFPKMCMTCDDDSKVFP